MTDIILSASQIDIARACLRKWAFRYTQGLPKPPTQPGDILGSKVHEVAEAYLKFGTAPNRSTREGAIFLKGLPYLPPPGTGGVEGYFTLELDGMCFQGYIDLATRGVVLPQWSLGHYPIVLDHKTSSNPLKYGKKAQDLLGDPQAILYTIRRGIDANTAGTVGLRWLYYRTSTRPKCFAVDMVWSGAQAHAQYEKLIAPLARRLVELHTNRIDANELEPSASACDSFGGCPYRGICKITPRERLAGLMVNHNQEDKVMRSDLLDKLRAMQGKAPVQAPVQAPVIADAVQAVNPPARRRRSSTAKTEVVAEEVTEVVAEVVAVPQSKTSCACETICPAKAAIAAALIIAYQGRKSPTEIADEAEDFLKALSK